MEIFDRQNKRTLNIHRVTGGPIFVELNDYKYILDTIDETKSKVKESGEHMFKIEEYNEQKHYECEQWKGCLEDIQRKFVYIQKTLFEKGP